MNRVAIPASSRPCGHRGIDPRRPVARPRPASTYSQPSRHSKGAKKTSSSAARSRRLRARTTSPCARSRERGLRHAESKLVQERLDPLHRLAPASRLGKGLIERVRPLRVQLRRRRRSGGRSCTPAAASHGRSDVGADERNLRGLDRASEVGDVDCRDSVVATTVAELPARPRPRSESLPSSHPVARPSSLSSLQRVRLEDDRQRHASAPYPSRTGVPVRLPIATRSPSVTHTML